MGNPILVNGAFRSSGSCHQVQARPAACYASAAPVHRMTNRVPALLLCLATAAATMGASSCEPKVDEPSGKTRTRGRKTVTYDPNDLDYPYPAGVEEWVVDGGRCIRPTPDKPERPVPPGPDPKCPPDPKAGHEPVLRMGTAHFVQANQ